MDRTGLEPVTSSMPSRRATSCANGPSKLFLVCFLGLKTIQLKSNLFGKLLYNQAFLMVYLVFFGRPELYKIALREFLLLLTKIFQALEHFGRRGIEECNEIYLRQLYSRILISARTDL